MKQCVTPEMLSVILGMRAAGYGPRLIGRYLGISYYRVTIRTVDRLAARMPHVTPAPLPADVVEKVGLIQHAPSRDRLLHYTDKSSGCWIWKGKKTNEGYGLICVATKYVTTHRESWRVFRGPIPEGQKVLHRCDTPLCVNPEHLFLGTSKDNMKDMRAKGRAPYIRNPVAPREQIIAIAASDKPAMQISRETGISYCTVRKIKAGKHWALRDCQS